MSDSLLLLPGDPGFAETLASPPPGWRNAIAGFDSYSFIVRPGSGLLEVATPQALREYLEGGEYDERLDEIDDEDDAL